MLSVVCVCHSDAGGSCMVRESPYTHGEPPTIPRKQIGSHARLKTLPFRNFVAGVGAQMMKQMTFSAGMILTLIRHCKEVQKIKRKDTAEILNPCY